MDVDRRDESTRPTALVPARQNNLARHYDIVRELGRKSFSDWIA